MSRRAHPEARQAEDMFLKVFHGSPVPITIASLESRMLVDANESWLRLFEYTREEVIGMPEDRLNLFDNPEDRRSILRLLKEHDVVRNFEITARTKTGRRLNVLFSADTVSIDGSAHVIATAMDITERKQIEGALKESEEKYRRIIETATEGIWVIDTEGRTTFSNKRMADMLGYSVEEIMGRKPMDFLTERDAEHLSQKLQHRFRGASERYEFKYQRKDGSSLWILANAVPIYKNGIVVGSLGMMTDITERKQAEKELQESEKWLSAIIEQLPVAVGILKHDNHFAMMNSIMAKFAPNGIMPARDPERASRFVAFDPEGQRIPVENWPGPRALRGEASPGMEVFCTDDEGRQSCHFVSAVPFLHSEKEIIGAIVVVQDLTDRKRMEEELRKSRDKLELRVAERMRELQTAYVTLEENERLYRSLFENASIGMFQTRIDGSCFIRINKAFATMLGYDSPEEVIAAITDTATQIHADPKSRPAILAALETNPWYYAEQPYFRKDGSTMIGALAIRMVLNPDGTPGYLEGIVEDITSRKNLEAQLIQSQKMEAIGTLAGGIAHDFNNMLAIILGNAELASDDLGGNQSAARNIEQIMKASKRARDLVRQILTFSRKTERGRNPLPLKPLVKETYRLLRGTIPSTIRMKLDIRAGSDTVRADPSQVQQIVVNLATNAAYAMRKDGGLLTISLTDVTLTDHDRPELPPGPYIRLSVQDTGTGMDDKVLGRIFEPFFTTKGRGEGTGMGLSVVYGIVKNHEGDITVESTAGEGSTFNIFLPLAEIEAVAEGEGADKMPQGTERILLVDDEPGVLQMTAQILRGLGYRVTAATGGFNAWKAFMYGPGMFDLVITDQVMPDLTGIALAEKIFKVRRDIPVILFTGYSETVSPEQAKATGISAYVMKPVTKKEVAETIRRVLETNAS